MSDYKDPNLDRELSWDDEIQHDSEFVLLPPGDYDFTVAGFERGRHNGSDKLPPCNKAVITLDVGDSNMTARITHNMFLHTKTEGMLCAFFIAIGQRKHGEKHKPRWNEVAGRRGRCKIGIREWTSTKTGEKMQSNEIKKFYEPEEQMTIGQAEQSAQNKSYQEGRF